MVVTGPTVHVETRKGNDQNKRLEDVGIIINIIILIMNTSMNTRTAILPFIVIVIT